jgi:L-galactose dehydrogenase
MKMMKVLNMKYRPLGNTGLHVSALSFGASSLGSVFHPINEDEGIRTVHAALDGGMNLIDVSPYYGLTKAETVLGKAIRQVDRSRFILSTKAGRYGDEDFDFSYDRIIRSIDESLSRLKTDYVDILLLHDIEFGDMNQVLNEGIPALNELKKQGKIRFTGVSGLPLYVFEHVLSVERVDVILSYCHYSLNDHTLLQLIPLLKEKGVGLLNASPLSMGLLSGKETASWHPASPRIKETCKLAAEYCERNGISLAKLAIQFSVNNEDIPTTLVSTADAQNILSNIAYMQEPINTNEMRKVMQLLQPILNDSWLSGKPEYNVGVKVG